MQPSSIVSMRCEHRPPSMVSRDVSSTDSKFASHASSTLGESNQFWRLATAKGFSRRITARSALERSCRRCIPRFPWPRFGCNKANKGGSKDPPLFSRHDGSRVLDEMPGDGLAVVRGHTVALRDRCSRSGCSDDLPNPAFGAGFTGTCGRADRGTRRCLQHLNAFHG